MKGHYYRHVGFAFQVIVMKINIAEIVTLEILYMNWRAIYYQNCYNGDKMYAL